MDNRFFSLIVVPDSGNNVKYSSFNSQFLISVFGVLIVVFFVCLFFIIGYHIKLRQENHYKHAAAKNHQLFLKIHQSEKLLETLSEKLDIIQKNDAAYRLYASMKTLDPDMYQAGVGGRVIFDRSEYSGLSDEMLAKIELLSYGLTRLERRTELGKNSMYEIQSQLKKNRDIIDNTPTNWPAITPYLSITSGFGSRINPVTRRYQFHDAVDIDGRRGDKIIAAADGVVTTAEWKGNLGQAVIIKHKYGYETTYGHLDAIQVKVGETVKKGQVIGAMGSTGRATGVHLHYSISQNGQIINPRMLLKAAM